MSFLIICKTLCESSADNRDVCGFGIFLWKLHKKTLLCFVLKQIHNANCNNDNSGVNFKVSRIPTSLLCHNMLVHICWY